MVGRYEMPGKNENGERMIRLQVERVGSWKSLSKKTMRKYTWIR